MFATRTILLLRAISQPAPAWPTWLGFGRRHHLARTVMEVKQHLLQCLRPIRPERPSLPAVIVVDAGANNADIQNELERWIERHPRLRYVQVVCSPASSWLKRIWRRNR
jgi:hypothetical protein